MLVVGRRDPLAEVPLVRTHELDPRVDRAAEERFQREPRGLVLQRAEAQYRATAVVRTHARGEIHSREPGPLMLRAGGTGAAVVVGIDAVPASFDRPDRKLVRRPRGPGLAGSAE